MIRLFPGLVGFQVAVAVGLAASAENPTAPLDGTTEQRIIHGTTVSPGAYPWVVGLVDALDEDAFSGQFCGGSLIHPRWVLTAAHCVEGTAPSELDVVLGHRDLTSGALIRVPVMDIIIHPAYDTFTNDADLALLLLPEIEEIAGIAPIPVVTNGDFEGPGTLARVLGWGGMDTHGTYPELLQMADVPIVANSLADSQYGLITDRMLFAGVATGGPNTCGGDSGGPLLVEDGAGGWLLAGVTSFGRSDVDCDAPDNFGGYTRVSEFTGWLALMMRPQQAVWEARHGVPADENDMDGDGLSGFAEFAFRTDPLIPDSPAAGVAAKTEVGQPLLSGFVLDSREFSIVPKASSDLETWTDAAGLVSVGSMSVPQTTPWDLFGHSAAWKVPTPGAASVFYRLDVSPSLRYSPPAYSLAPGTFAHKGRTRLDLSTRPGETPPVPLSDDHVYDYFLIDNSDAETATGVWHLSVRSDAFEPEVGFPAGFHLPPDIPGMSMAAPASSTVLSTGVDHRLLAIEFPDNADRVPFYVHAADFTSTGDYRVALFRPFSLDIPLQSDGTYSAYLTTTDDTHRVGETAVSYHDLYGLDAFAADEFVTVRMSSTAVDATLALVDLETGQEIFSNDDGFASGLDAFLDFVAPTGGFPARMALRAGAVGNRTVGRYDLLMARGASLPVGGETTNGALSATDPLDPEYRSSDYYRDDYLLSGFTPGAPVTMTMQGAAFDAYLYVLDAATGHILGTADDFAVGGTETLRFTPQAGHHYIVRATSYNQKEVGAYTIRAFQWANP